MGEQALNYRISGSGNPVIFLHGFMENLHMWDQLLDDFPCEAICIDLNGHGESELVDQEELSIVYMANQVANIILKEKLEHAVIVGHSMGGYVGLELMKQFPSLEHLVLFHSHPWEDSPEKKRDRERVAELVQTKSSVFIHEAIPNLFFHPESNQKAIEKYIQMAERMLPKSIAWAARAMKNRNNNEQLLIENPNRFCFVVGENDKLISSEEVKAFCMRNEVPFVIIPEVGHMAHEEEILQTKSILQAILLEN